MSRLKCHLQMFLCTGTSLEDYKKSAIDVQMALEVVHVGLDTLEATLRVDTQAPAKVENQVISISLIRRSDKRQARKSKTDVQYVLSGSSDYDSDPHSADSSLD